MGGQGRSTVSSTEPFVGNSFGWWAQRIAAQAFTQGALDLSGHNHGLVAQSQIDHPLTRFRVEESSIQDQLSAGFEDGFGHRQQALIDGRPQLGLKVVSDKGLIDRIRR